MKTQPFGCRVLSWEPPGVCVMTFHPFFFLNQNEKYRLYVRIIENSKLGRFHGPLIDAGGKIGGWGVF